MHRQRCLDRGDIERHLPAHGQLGTDIDLLDKFREILMSDSEPIDAEGQPLETRLSGGIAIAGRFKPRRPALQVDPCRDRQPGWVAHFDDQLPFQTVRQRTGRTTYLNQAHNRQKNAPEPAPCGPLRLVGVPKPLGTSSITAVPPAGRL